MGNSRIDFQLTSPRERRLGVQGFEGFINRIKTICSNRNIQFINQSFSPSAYAVRNGNTNIPEFVDFLREHLFLNHF
jgi:UDP-N-acetylmuramoylalanine-D-glutamate ligase